jgi:(p)ppGpp synthase/HD superfamily hydrolase
MALDPACASCRGTGFATRQPSVLVRSAMKFAARSHANQRRDSDGEPFIEHPVEVARLLRDAGCPDVVIAAGLLHDVLENSHTSIAELTACFGADVANLVQAVSDDASIPSYRQRKQLLREQVRSAGGDATLIFAADKISKIRELPDRVARNRARYGTALPAHVQHDHQLRVEHYTESLRMLQAVAPRHPLVIRLANELRNCTTAATTRFTRTSSDRSAHRLAASPNPLPVDIGASDSESQRYGGSLDSSY